MSIIKVVKARNSKYDPPAGGRNSERGDTIVEVMFAMAIIGVVLAAAYGIASKNLQTSQLAKERTQATQIAESQLEQLKALRDDPADGNFCLDIESASYITTIADVNNITEPECISGFFSKSITKNVDGNNPDEYLIVVEWVPPGGREDNKSKVELKYKDYDYDLSGTQNLAVFIVSYSGNSAVLGVRIINESSSSNRGIVYGTVNDPTIGAVGTIGTIPNVANEDSFNSTLVGLNPSTTYYARVYVETAPGVYKYGRSIRISNSATTPVTAPPPVVLGGSAYSSCVGSGGFSCNNVGSSVTSCANFRVDYDVTPPSGAGYNAVVIDYGDYYCGGPVQAPPRDWYNFNVDVYINGVRNVVDAQLDAQGGSAVVPLVGNFASISSIGVDWTNNYWISSETNPYYSDPDLQINGVRLVYRDPASLPRTKPVVTTGAVSGVTRTRADVVGNIVSDGGSTILESGIAYSESVTPPTYPITDFPPSIGNRNQTSNGASPNFVTNLTSLKPNKTYYARAYARNTQGYSYANNYTSFTTQAVGAGYTKAGEYGGHHYYLYNSTWDWINANTAANNLEGHLVTISSAGENAFVSGLYRTGSVYDPGWIGLSDVTTEGTWTWVSGEPFGYSNWAPGEPNNSLIGSPSGQDYALINWAGLVGQWDDQYATQSSLKFIVEYD